NIGAYGQELSEVLDSIEFLDAETGERERLAASDLELGYRTSSLKRGRHGVVLSLDLRLEPSPLSAPLAYDHLAQALGLAPAARIQGHGARPGRPRLGERRLLLHEPDRDRELRACTSG